jgi:ADP-ribose pyrophosphatase
MIVPWRVLESTITYAYRWLRVRSDRCVNGAGAEIAPYHVLEYADWVNVLALTPTDQVVMIHQYRHGIGSVILELPAGAVEAADGDAVAAARRELAEETGFQADEVVLLPRTYANPASHNNLSWSCLGLGARLVGAPAPELGEDIEVECRDLLALLRDVERGALTFQATHLATLHFAVDFILRSERADLRALRARLREHLLGRPA